MTRARQIAAVDSNMRDKVLQSPNFRSRPTANGYSNNGYAFPRNNAPGLLYRLRSTNASHLIMSGCGSMRDFCNNVQTITNDINNLLTSVESILPIVSTYLSLTPAKETIPVTPESPRLNGEVIPATSPSAPQPQPMEQAAASPAQITTRPTQNNNINMAAPPMSPGNMPKLRPEDIQQLLNNPLVKNLMTSFMSQGQK